MPDIHQVSNLMEMRLSQRLKILFSFIVYCTRRHDSHVKRPVQPRWRWRSSVPFYVFAGMCPVCCFYFRFVFVYQSQTFHLIYKIDALRGCCPNVLTACDRQGLCGCGGPLKRCLLCFAISFIRNNQITKSPCAYQMNYLLSGSLIFCYIDFVPPILNWSALKYRAIKIIRTKPPLTITNLPNHASRSPDSSAAFSGESRAISNPFSPCNDPNTHSRPTPAWEFIFGLHSSRIAGARHSRAHQLFLGKNRSSSCSEAISSLHRCIPQCDISRIREPYRYICHIRSGSGKTTIVWTTESGLLE